MADTLRPYAEHFVNTKGPGDERPTALQILKDEDLINKWAGKVVLITGATSGIGVETARALYATGADVYITARDTSKAKKVIDDIHGSSESNGKIDFVEMDMNSLESVKKVAKEFLAKSDNKLNVLVNNAGIMAAPESKTVDGFELQFGTNHLAHFTLTALLLPTLVQSSTPTFNSRVVSVSSFGHRVSPVVFDDVNLTGKYDPWVAYGQSKTANIWLANYIDRVYGQHGVHANSLHPGIIETPLQDHIRDFMNDNVKNDPELRTLLMSTEQGAATTVWAATAKVWEGQGGRFLYHCGVGEPSKNDLDLKREGYAKHAFDVEGEDKLWKLKIGRAHV